MRSVRLPAADQGQDSRAHCFASILLRSAVQLFVTRHLGVAAAMQTSPAISTEMIALCPNSELKEIPWAPGYFVSSCGRVFSTLARKVRELKVWSHPAGYPQVHLYPRGKK